MVCFSENSVTFNRFFKLLKEFPVNFHALKPLIDRVVANLLGNAIKFSPRGGLVRVVTSFRDRTANLAIHDQGPGIAPEDRAGLFQRYYRGSESRADSTGLGLWIVKSITEAHGGAVSTDRSPDGGSVFQVSIPCDKI